MAVDDAALQALLDPAANGRGIRIVRRLNDGNGTTGSYYCVGNVTGVSKAMWLTLTDSESDAQHNTAVRTAFGVA